MTLLTGSHARYERAADTRTRDCTIHVASISLEIAADKVTEMATEVND